MPFRRRFDEDYREHLLVEPPFKKLLGEYGCSASSSRRTWADGAWATPTTCA